MSKRVRIMANNTEYVNRVSWGSVRVAVASRSPRNSMLISREIRNMEQCRDYRKEKKRKKKLFYYLNAKTMLLLIQKKCWHSLNLTLKRIFTYAVTAGVNWNDQHKLVAQSKILYISNFT